MVKFRGQYTLRQMLNSIEYMSCPGDPVEPYDDGVIRDPWPHYARLRGLGPVVRMEALGNYGFTQYDAVRAGLHDLVGLPDLGRENL